MTLVEQLLRLHPKPMPNNCEGGHSKEGEVDTGKKYFTPRPNSPPTVRKTISPMPLLAPTPAAAETEAEPAAAPQMMKKTQSLLPIPNIFD